MIGSSFSSVDNLPLVIFPPFSQDTATGNLGQIFIRAPVSSLYFEIVAVCFVFSKLSISHTFEFGFPGASGKEPTCQCRRHKRCRFDPGIRKTPWTREWQPTPVFLSGEVHGQRSLAGYSPRGCTESDVTKQQQTVLRVASRVT